MKCPNCNGHGREYLPGYDPEKTASFLQELGIENIPDSGIVICQQCDGRGEIEKEKDYEV